MMDNYDLWYAHDSQLESQLRVLPECCECGEKIQDEYLFEINDEYICERCMESNHRKCVDDLIV